MATGFDRRRIPAAAREDWWTAPDGHRIRRIEWTKPDAAGPTRGSILFMPGRGDCYEKHIEAFEDWRLQGWQVSAADWRGQAGSGRFGKNGAIGHIDDFMVWVNDLAGLWRDFASRHTSQHTSRHRGPLVLIGHSMGGHLALRAAIEQVLEPRPDAMVLTAPMFDVHPDWVPQSWRRGLAHGMVRLGDSRRSAWGDGEKPIAVNRLRQQLLTHDDERYDDERFWRDARPDLKMGAGSWGWVRAAMDSVRAIHARGAPESVTIPTLVIATAADPLVSPRATRRILARLPDAEALIFGSESRHEVLREVDPVRSRAMAAIDDFLARRCPA